MNFKESHPWFFLILLKIFKSLCERWMKKKERDRLWDLNSHPSGLKSIALSPTLPTHLLMIVAKKYWKLNFCFYRFLRGLTSFILTFFHKLKLNHDPTFSTCWKFELCLFYDSLGPSMNSIQFLEVIFNSPPSYLQFFSYTKGF